MKISELRAILTTMGRAPKRSLGQNFLLDKNLARRAVECLALRGGELVVEIGPGVGSLTEELIPSPAEKILLLEKDDQFVDYLKEKFVLDQRIEVVAVDALQWDLGPLFTGQRAVLLGSLPYNIATPLLMHFGSAESPIERMVIIVQEEVAERICAEPCNKHYGGWTVLFGRRWRGEIVQRIKPEAFCPRPRVMSALVRLERRPLREVVKCDGAELERLVWQGFSCRRKQLRKQLGCEADRWLELATELGFSPMARAEELTIRQWQQLAARLSRVEDYSPVGEMFDVVDEHDRPIGSLPREEIHACNLRHRSSHILLANHKNELFLQKRAAWKDINPGVWDSSAAGHLDAGEDYEAAAHRELQEELGVDTFLEQVGKLTPCPETGNEFIAIFFGRHEGPFRLAGLEAEAGRFFPLPQIEAWARCKPTDFSPVFLLCLEILRQKGILQDKR